MRTTMSQSPTEKPAEAASNPREPTLPVLDALLDQQSHCWQQGKPIRVETLLTRHPMLHTEPQAVLDLIYHEVLLREQRGERPDLEEYARRFPDYAAQLVKQFKVHGALQ